MVRQGRTAIMLQVAVLVSASVLEVAANFAASDLQSGTVRFLAHFALPAVVMLLLMAVVGDVLVFRMENPAADRPVWNALRVPYPGLSAFSEADAPVYFGRDARIAELIRRLHAVESSEADRFVCVTGASGGGKSSLVHECPATGLARRTLMASLTESHVEVALVGHTATVRAGAWSPDARRIVMASRDGTARIWDAATGTTKHVLRGHDGMVDGVAWSPDSRLVASASRDYMVRIPPRRHSRTR
jgi:hypothetical protein